MLGIAIKTPHIFFIFDMILVIADACIFNLKKLFLFKIFTKIFTKLILEVTQLILKLNADSDCTMAQVQ